MEREFKLLMLEDTPEDAVLIKRTLQRSNLKLKIKLVSTRHDFIEALSSFAPEIVLSDHQLPHFSSTEALEVCKQVLPFVPFILVTGAVSEEFAASIIKAGADDYLLKDNLTRLPTAILQAVQKKRTEESLRNSEANLRAIFDNTDTGFILIDTAFIIQSFNRTFAHLAALEFHKNVEEGESIFHVIREERQDRARHIFEEVLKGQTVVYDLEFVQGSGRWYHYRVSPVCDAHNAVIGIISAIADISARKIAEDKLKDTLQRLVFHMENTPLGFIEWDNQFKIRSWSRRSQEIFGWTEKEFSEMGSYDHVYIEDAPIVRRNAQQLPRAHIVSNNAVNRNYTKEGRVIWCQWFNSALKDKDGKVITYLSMVQDITEQKTAELLLKQSNERYELVSKATSDAIWDWDIEKDTTFWNHGLKTLFGYEESGMANPDGWWQDRIHPDDHGRVAAEIEETFRRQRGSWISNYRYRCANGKYLHVFDRAHVIYKDGKPERMIGAMQDVDEHFRTLEEVKRLSIVASKTDNSVMILDKEYRIEWANDSFTKLTGYGLKESVGKKPFEFLCGPETDASVLKMIIERVKSTVPVTEEIINYNKDGKAYWVRVTITPVFNELGDLDRFVTIQSDVTSQKEFEQKITVIARELANLIENSNVPIFGIDRNGYINEWNAAAKELTSYSKNEVLGKQWTKFFNEETHKNVGDIFEKALQGEATRNFELPFFTKEGKALIFLMSISPRMDVQKSIKGAFCVGHDITEVIRYRQDLENIIEKRTHELNNALQKEKEQVDLRGKFVSIASHEFRTPLSTIIFAVESIRNHFHQLTEEQIQRKLMKIEDQASHMTVLLEDILTIGKSEANKIKPKPVRVDLREFVNSLIEEINSSGRISHEIIYDYSSKRNTITIDDKLLRNVLVNLLTNALKFSLAQTPVKIDVSDALENILIEVTDEGIGIEEEDLTSIFEAFQRGSNVSTVQGTGLGLSIVKKAVELLNGSISVQSVVNKGTTFKVLIPAR